MQELKACLFVFRDWFGFAEKGTRENVNTAF